MRPGVYGKQYIIKNSRLIGINLGYNYFVEHEMENMQDFVSMMAKLSCRDEVRQQMKNPVKKAMLQKKSRARAKRWEGTPFKGSVLRDYTNSYYKQGMVIKNDELISQGKGCILHNGGKYDMLMIGNDSDIRYMQDKFGNKRVFTEADLFPMSDYQYLSSNYGYQQAAAGGAKMTKNSMVGSDWDGRGLMVYLIETPETEGKLKHLQQALEAGNLAVVTHEPRLFKDRGCCLIDLDAAYCTQKYSRA